MRRGWKIVIGILVVIFVALGIVSFTVGIPKPADLVNNLSNPPEDLSKDLSADEALQQQEAKEWDYTNDIVTANVTGTDLENNTLTVSFVWPPGFITKIFGDKEPTSTVKVSCTEEESTFTVTRVSKDQQTPKPQDTEVLETGINIVSGAQSGDTVIAYCADEKCSEFIRVCELNRTILVEE